MQLKKEEVRKKIMEVAKRDFLEKGFEKVSVREIARIAGVTTGSIYTYFKNKEMIFYEIVKPAIDTMRAYLDFERIEEKIKKGYPKEKSNFDLVRESTKEFFGVVEGIREELNLLFFCAGGSTYTDYREEIIQLYVDFMKKHFKSLERRNIMKVKDISEPFLHALAGFYVSTIKEIISHVNDAKTKKLFIEQLSIYLYHGFNGTFWNLK